MQCILLSYKFKTAHLASSLSCVDLISVIFFSEINLNKKNINEINRDRFILSKGHAATALYSVLFFKKIILKKDLFSYTKKNSFFEEHPSPKIPGVDVATGSLGHGLSVACGIALGCKINKNKSKIYVLMSDGECNEGSVWEAVLFAAAKKLNNIFCFIDYNKWQATGRTSEILDLKSLKNKFKAFGWDVLEIDGHSHKEIRASIKLLNRKNSNKPKIVIGHTIKGKGISYMENDNNWHYRSPNKKELLSAKKELNYK